jgi:hypothetical protein
VVLWESVLHERGNVHQSKPTQYKTAGNTHHTAELRTTMWALANDAQSCRVALSIGADLGLAALLGRHELLVVKRGKALQMAVSKETEGNGMLAYIRDERVQGRMEVRRKRSALYICNKDTATRNCSHKQPTFRSGDRSVPLPKA